MPETRVVTGFLPTTSGLHFRNAFPPGPTLRIGPLATPIFGIGDASAGLCGGMCAFVRRHFEAGQPVPSDSATPANGSPLFMSLVREQVRSLRWGIVPLRFWQMSRRSAAERATRTRDLEWPRIKAALDRGRLVVIGLVRAAGANPIKLVANHQVIAYGYDVEGDDVRIRVYDPNHPDSDDVWVPIDGTRPQSTGETLLGVTILD